MYLPLDRYREAVGGGESVGVEEGEEAGVAIWSHLFKAVVALVGKIASQKAMYDMYWFYTNQVRQLHSRDTRHQFCPSQHWIQPRLALPLDRPEGVSFHRSRFGLEILADLFSWDPIQDQSLSSLPRSQGVHEGGIRKFWTTPFYQGGFYLPWLCISWDQHSMLQGATCDCVERVAFHHLLWAKGLSFPGDAQSEIHIQHNHSCNAQSLIMILEFWSWSLTLIWYLKCAIRKGSNSCNSQSLIQREKQEQQGDRVNFLQGPSIDLHVRRS